MARRKEILKNRIRSFLGPTKSSTPMIKLKEKKSLDKGQYQEGGKTRRGYGTYV